MLTNDNRIRRYGLCPYFIALKGNQSHFNHFPSSWKSVRPDLLAFDHKPCRTDLSQVPTRADLTPAGPRVLNPKVGLIHSTRLWDFSHQQTIGVKISEVLVLCFQRIRACETNESQYQPILPGILQKDFCALLYLDFFVYGCRARRDMTGLMFSPSVQVLMYRPCAATTAPHLDSKLLTCWLLPFARNLSFRNKIAVHSNFHNSSRGLVSFLQWYMNSVPLMLPGGRSARKHPIQTIELEHPQL